MTWVWDHAGVAGTDLLLLLAIADHADDHGGNAWPSIATLAAKTRLDPRTVRRVITRLEAAGHLVITRRAGRSQTNRYTLLMTAPTEPADTPAEPVGAPTDEKGADCPAPLPPKKGADCPRPAPPEKGADCHGGVLPGGAGARGVRAQLRPHHEGTATPYEPPVRPLTTTTPAAPSAAGAEGTDSDCGGGGDHLRHAMTVLDQLGPSWPLTPAQRQRLAPRVGAALAAGWSTRRLGEVLASNPDGVRSPVAVLTDRLAGLPPPPVGAEPAAAALPWCGDCDRPDYRWIEVRDGHWAHCPRCHPSRRGQPRPGPEASGPPPPHRIEEPERPSHGTHQPKAVRR
jgi:Helix-turn-helix domain